MTEPVTKHFISADDLLEASFTLARDVLRSGFVPEVIVGIWRGGTPVAIAVHEAMTFLGVRTKHMPVCTSSYSGIGTQGEVEVTGLELLTPILSAETRLLLVDDVYDSGRSIAAIKRALGAHLPTDTRVATAYFKPHGSNYTGRPDYFAVESHEWLVFPHELQGLTKAEIAAHKPLAAVLLS